MRADNFHWSRLPDDQVDGLISAYREERVGDVLRILNRHRVGDGILTMCCGIGIAWQAIERQIETEWTTTRDSTQK